MAIYKLELLLYGLIALHPDHPTTPTTIHAYLVDAREPAAASDGCLGHCHVPFVAFEVAEEAECSAPCSTDPLVHRTYRRDADPIYCFCDVTRQAISFHPEEKRPAGTLLYYPPSNFPTKSDQAKDFVWTLRMRSVAPTAAEITDGLLRQKAVADLKFGWTALQTCHLATFDYGGPISVFRFKPLASTTPAPIHRQAGSEAVMATLRFESESKPELRLTSYDNENDVKKIPLPCTATADAELTCNPIHLVNRALKEEGHCGEGVKGREFELYYQLSEISPVQFRQVVPHLTIEEEEAVQAEGCGDKFLRPKPKDGDDCRLGFVALAFEEAKAVSGRPICMMVVFD